MAGGIEVDAERRARLHGMAARPEGEHLCLALVEIVDLEVAVRLLGVLLPGPLGAR